MYHELIDLFAEKSAKLAIEVIDLLRSDTAIRGEIALIIAHQAVEHILKAMCLHNGRSISAGGGKSITYEEALRRTRNIIDGKDEYVLSTVNDTRNQIQHNVISKPSFELRDMIWFSLEMVRKLLSVIERKHSKLNLLLNRRLPTEKVPRDELLELYFNSPYDKEFIKIRRLERRLERNKNKKRLWPEFKVLLEQDLPTVPSEKPNSWTRGRDLDSLWKTAMAWQSIGKMWTKIGETQKGYRCTGRGEAIQGIHAEYGAFRYPLKIYMK